MAYDLPQKAQLQAYVDAFLRENAVHNLSAARTQAHVWEHVHDSLALNELNLPQQAKVLDVGSGGGLPGVPLAITHPQWTVTLLDSVAKKADAVNRIIESVQAQHGPLALKAFAMAGRAEEFGRVPEHRFQYDIVVARAVAALPTLLEYVVPFMKQDGVAVLYKGPSAIEEIAQSKRAFDRLNAQLDEVRAYGPYTKDLPQKTLLVVRRAGLLEDQYPRANGIPKKKPL